MNTIVLKAEAQRVGFLREKLRADYPDIDDETLSGTLEGLTDLPEQLGAVIRSALEDECLAEALKGRLADMRERLARLQGRAERKRALVGEVMREAGLPRLVTPEFTASIRPVPPGLVITDESRIPNRYWTPQPPKFSRQEVLAALKAGTAVPGAALSNGGSTLAVRTR